MNIVIGLMPALFWGVLPLWLRRFTGGGFRSQLLGTALGIMLVAACIHMVQGYSLPFKTWGLFLLSGFCWSFGQAGQYYCYEKLGVSVTMPLSTALQVVGNSLIGGLFFGEWSGASAILSSLAAMVIIVIGVFLTNGKGLKGGKGRPRDYLVLLVSTVGYWGYSAFPLMVTNVESKLEGFLPQSVGMVIAATLIGLSACHEIVDGATMRNISGGFIFSVAAATYLISMSMNGMVNAFVLSQLNVLVSTLSGAIVLKELPKDGVPRVVLGLIVLIVGAALMVM